MCIKLVIVQDYTKMRGQHNIKKKTTLLVDLTTEREDRSRGHVSDQCKEVKTVLLRKIVRDQTDDRRL